MIKIDSELKNTKDRCTYSDSYLVTFMILEDGHWIKGEKRYYATNKDSHEEVGCRWDQDYAGKDVKHICTTYE